MYGITVTYRTHLLGLFTTSQLLRSRHALLFSQIVGRWKPKPVICLYFSSDDSFKMK